MKGVDTINIQTYPHQKIITVVSEEHNQDKLYGCISREAANKAAQLLNDSTVSYILFTHFALNKNGYQFALSPKALNNELGISQNQYDRAVKRLIKAGYLVNTHGNNYNFYELPQTQEPIPRQTNPCQNERLSPCITKDYPHAEQGIIPMSKEVEIVKDKQNKKDNNDLSFGVDFGNDKDTLFESIELLPEKRQEIAKEHKDHIRGLWSRLYKLKLDNRFKSPWDFVKSQHILARYLNENTETPIEKRLGDTFGRFIRGWDNEKQQPIIGYTITPILPRENIDEIPKEYYTK